MRKRVLISCIAVIAMVAIGFFALAWRPAIPPIDPPVPASFSALLIAKGRVLAGAGNCAPCHTSEGGKPFAGGHGLLTPFGTIFSTNITPEPDTGIGRWSLEAFRRAMHEGIARDGSHLFPAFPFDHFTKVSDEDVEALYAYLMTRPPMPAETPANTVPFPLNIRALQQGWKFLFFESGRYRPDETKNATWNRGAYLAEGLSHCGGCHTPRNLLGAEKVTEAYAGAEIDGWLAPALTEANPSPAPWTESELFGYLRNGVTALHGVAAGPMSPVVHAGLAAVPDGDVRALALYFSDTGHGADPTRTVEAATGRALALSPVGSSLAFDPGARLYAGACIACHYNAKPVPLAARPELALNSALTLPEPTNFIRTVLEGIGAAEGAPGLVMPAYAESLTDDDIATLAAYLRRTRTDQPAWSSLKVKVAAVRRESAALK